MRIIHTSDLHLRRDQPKRLEALTEIVSQTHAQQADLLIIAGDLFDNPGEAELLRPKLRSLFDSMPCPILAIPGNHDERVYNSGTYFGQGFEAISQLPFGVRDWPGTRVVAIPYSQGSFVPLIQALKQAVTPDQTNILVLHCTWALPHYSDTDYGSDTGMRYLPVTSELLTGLGYDFILAGHFHTNYRQHRLPCGALFVYSGSPVSITSREQGQRSVNLLADNVCTQLLLNTWHWQTLTIQVTPANQEHVLAELAAQVAGIPANCDLTLVMSGFIRGSEQLYKQQADLVLSDFPDISFRYEIRDITRVLDDPIYKRFISRLEAAGLDPSLKERAAALGLEAFTIHQTGDNP